MNKTEYRRALIMLRSLKAGLSGYVRLERRTLTGTLQFTVNGVSPGQELFAVLLRKQNGAWTAVKAGSFSAPRHGQSGLLWTFDPRSIDGKAFEQYPLTAVISISGGICDLLLCGTLNGTPEVDWMQIRDAACRLFSPVRIAGTPISPIDEASPSDEPDHTPGSSEEPTAPGQTDDPLPEETPPEAAIRPEEEPQPDSGAAFADEANAEPPADRQKSASSDSDSPAVSDIPAGEQPADALPDASRSDQTESVVSPPEPDELDSPAVEPDELDTPAAKEHQRLLIPARTTRISGNASSGSQTAPDSAGSMLDLSNPDAPWPDSIEPLRGLFFSSEAVTPFEAADYVLIQAPLPSDTGMEYCVVGIRTENGIPQGVLYAIPARYTPEPPPGLDGYIWQGDQAGGYWITEESVSPDAI